MKLSKGGLIQAKSAQQRLENALDHLRVSTHHLEYLPGSASLSNVFRIIEDVRAAIANLKADIERSEP